MAKTMREFYRVHGANRFGVDHNELYAVERALRDDLNLDHEGESISAGRPGPGGGNVATPFKITCVLLAVMSGKLKKDLGEAVLDLWHGVTYPDRVDQHSSVTTMPRCPVTGALLFGTAVNTILGDVELAQRVVSITVNQRRLSATITFKDEGGGTITVPFGKLGDDDSFERFVGGLHTVATIGGAALEQFAYDLKP